MDSLEKQAVQELYTALINDLDPKYIRPYLYEKKYLSKEEYEQLVHGDRIPRVAACEKLLLDIVDKCPFEIFLNALRYKKAYPHLADSLEEKLKCLKEEYVTQRQEKEELFVSVGKIKMDNRYRKQLAALAHGLKKLSHDGNVDAFRRVTENIHKRCRMHNFRDTIKATDEMKQADVRFIVLDAEIEARRLKYDVTLYQSDVFQSMKDLIPYTTNPTVSSMTFLARYGSSLTMRESIDTGLKQLDIAKQHATQVQPCKETGMVFYIEINLLFQQYEKNPDFNLKENILKRTDLAISHFNEDEFGRDYQRMLLLKKAFCHLGIGLFGERIPHAIVNNQDVSSAGNCLDFVEKKVWDGIEARRKMFFMIAKSEWYRRQDKYEFAKMYAKRANKLANKNEWKKEAENIIHLLEDIDSTYAKHTYVFDDVECIQKYVDEILTPNDDDYIEKDRFLHMNDKAQCIVSRVHKGDSFLNLDNGSFGVSKSAVHNRFEPQILITPGLSERLVSVCNNDPDILDDDDDDDDDDDNDKLYFTDEKDHKWVDKAILKTAVKHQCIKDRVRKDQSYSDLKNGSFGVVESSADNRFDYQTISTSGKSKQIVSIINVNPDQLDDDDDDDDQLNLINESDDTVAHKELFVNVGVAQCVTDRFYKAESFSNEKNGSFRAVESSAHNELDHQTFTTPGINEGLINVSNVNNDRLDDGYDNVDNTLDMTEETHDTGFDKAILKNVVKEQCLKDRIHKGDSLSNSKNGIFGVREKSVDSLLDLQTLTTSEMNERLVSVSNIDPHILDYNDDDDDQLDLTDINEDIMVNKEPFVNVVKSPCLTDMVHKCDSLSDVQKGSFGVVSFDHQTLTTPGSNEGLASIVRNVIPDKVDNDCGKLDLRDENKETVVDKATVKNVVDLRKRKLIRNMKLSIQQNIISDTLNKITMSKVEIVRPDGYEPNQKKTRLTEYS